MNPAAPAGSRLDACRDRTAGPVELYLGDAHRVLKRMPDASVDCVATSPPFWGLRDYGTGRWEGGRFDCDHEHRPDERYSGATCLDCPAVWVDPQYGLEATSKSTSTS